jgi:hypothetical protein
VIPVSLLILAQTRRYSHDICRLPSIRPENLQLTLSLIADSTDDRVGLALIRVPTTVLPQIKTHAPYTGDQELIPRLFERVRRFVSRGSVESTVQPGLRETANQTLFHYSLRDIGCYPYISHYFSAGST